MLIGEVDLVRGALAAVLTHQEDLVVTGEVSLRQNVLAAARQRRPAVVVLDIDRYGAAGLTMAHRLADELPESRVLLLTSRQRADLLRGALEAGVWGEASLDSWPAERAALSLAGAGLRSWEIGAKLFLSPGTVRNYVSTAIRKTGARNRLEALRRAQDAGWL